MEIHNENEDSSWGNSHHVRMDLREEIQRVITSRIDDINKGLIINMIIIIMSCDWSLFYYCGLVYLFLDMITGLYKFV